LQFITIDTLETREKIKDLTIERIALYGVRGVTMDDIARGAGVSKKTIYQEFGDKEQLIYEIFTETLEKDARALDDMFTNSSGIIDHLVKMSRFIRSKFTHMHPMVLNEIQRYYPRCWQKFEEFKKDHALQGLIVLMERGKEEGLFRSEINSEILATLRLEQITLSFDPTRFPPERFNMVEVQMQLFDSFIFGILTEKGKQVYEEQFNNQDIEK
jgi:TetR/AcrR family transcriptional regulator, cholesterol catabolism regulator